ncbi:RDD family protein [Spongiivirga sp. MCCC 1A20706]|uniref:RDD family protein n=1 Tax=Spongiivirga sp. MCCC 1A20706 TaxID=3160963 RepID=UPI00397725A6
MLFQKPYPNNLDLAGENTRINNFIIDFLVSIILAYMAAKFTNELSGDSLMSLVVFIMIRFMYYFLPEKIYGKTLGKMITKTKVVDINRQEPTTLMLIKRTLLRAVTLLLTFISDENVAFHDQFSKTYVVNEV